MDELNFFYQVKESVIDFKFYKHIKDNRFAKSFLYLLLLMFIVYSVITARNFLYVKNVMQNVAFNLSESLPNFELKDGKFSFEGKMPYYISSSTDELFVIDTTGQVTPQTLNTASTGILITADYAYIKNGIQTQQLNFSEMRDSEFSKKDLIEFLPNASWLVLIFMMIWFVFALGGHLLYAVLLALFGLSLSAGFKADLKFNHLLNFSIYALTFPMLVDLAIDLSGLPIPQLLFFMIYSTIAVTYLLFAIRAYVEERNFPEQSNDSDLM